MKAPWRSLIYRNVDTPFTYAEAYAIFPHMPMNTAGYDCRAPRIVGEWMTSIPSRRINSELSEDADPTTPAYDNTPQPYEEVKPGDEGYEDAVDEADARRASYMNDVRYGYCPNTTDIVDLGDLAAAIALAPTDETICGKMIWCTLQMLPKDGVPDRAPLGRHRSHRGAPEIGTRAATTGRRCLIEHDPPALDPNRPTYPERARRLNRPR